MLRKGFSGSYHYKAVRTAWGNQKYHEAPAKEAHSHPYDALQFSCKKLQNQGIDYSRDAFFQSIAEGDLDVFSLFLAAGMPLEAKWKGNETALITACGYAGAWPLSGASKPRTENS